MTSEEIIERLRTMKAAWMMAADTTPESRGTAAWAAEAINCAISALKGPTREQVEKVWRGKWIGMTDDDGCTWYECSRCEHDLDSLEVLNHFCPACGAAQTDVAVDMVMERLEALYEET